MNMLSDGEKRAIAVLVRHAANGYGEDIIGAILRTGAFHYLPDHDLAVVDLANLLETWEALNGPMGNT